MSLDEMMRAVIMQNHEVCQILGTALRYPTEGPEVGGDHTTVCVGDHVAESLAVEAARRIAELEAEVKVWRGRYRRLHDEFMQP